MRRKMKIRSSGFFTVNGKVSNLRIERRRLLRFLDLRSGAGFAQQVLCICLPQKIETAQNRSIGFNIINFERIPLNQSLINESLIQKAKGHSSYGTHDLAAAGL
jgi:hypothetical protein